MGLYDGKSMRPMTQAHFNDTKLDKSRELNESMSIDPNKAGDPYTKQVHSLSKQTFTEDTQEV